MGRKISFVDSESYDDPLFLADLDDETLLDEPDYYEKPAREFARRKRRSRRQAARNRFSDYEDERWLRRQIEDWDDFSLYDDFDSQSFEAEIGH